jgi:death on curing protein
MVSYLTLEEVLRLHFQIISDYGGSHGVRDEGRLQSVVLAPRQEVFGKEQYVDIYEKVATYMRNIIADHAFVDGNKRSAVAAAGVFLRRNGIRQTATPKALEDFAVKVAVGHLDVPAIAAWLRDNSEDV